MILFKVITKVQRCVTFRNDTMDQMLETAFKMVTSIYQKLMKNYQKQWTRQESNQ